MRNTWPFPVAADPLRAYIDLGGLVALLWRRDRLPMRICEFCRTANPRRARCEVCGTGQIPHAASFPERPDTLERRPEAVPLRSIGLVVGRIVILPLLLFAAFFMWYALHHQARAHSAQDTQPKSQTTVTSIPVKAEANRQATIATLSPVKAMTHTSALPRSAHFWSASTISRRPIRTHRTSGSEAGLNSCAGRNMLMRAVCVNNVCAAPNQAQRPQCAEAVAQRRIDEDRRNPILVN